MCRRHRSWTFGFEVNRLLRVSGRHPAFLVAQLGALLGRRSLVMNAFLWFGPGYAVLLLLGVGALASAGFLAVVASAPLYMAYVIPRYVIAAVLLGYLMVGEMVAGRKA